MVITVFKNFKRRSLKGKIIIVSFFVCLALLISFVLYTTFKPDPPQEYEMAKVAYGNMTETLDVSGKVETGVKNDLVAVEGVMVEEVFVNVGDRVKKGDKLASFNINGILKYLNNAKSDYEKSLKVYNDAVKNDKAASDRKASLKNEISSVKSLIEAKKKEISALESEISKAEPQVQTQKLPQSEIDKVVEQMKNNGATQEQIDAFIEGASKIETPVVSNSNAEKQQALMKKNIELAELNSKLTALTAENAAILDVDKDGYIKSLKTASDVKKEYYDKVSEIYTKMKNGWFAEFDGIVTAVNLEAGKAFVPKAETEKSTLDLSSILGSGTVDGGTAAVIASLLGNSQEIPCGTGVMVESYDDMIVAVSVGKGDLLKIKKGMTAQVKSLDKEYEGEVVYVGATASESEGLNLNSITSSLMGNGSAGGAVVKIKIKNPDEKVVIGFDVDIKIKLATIENVLTIPVEAVLYNSGEYSVYVFNEKEGVVEKRKIQKGMLDDKSYQVLDGLAEGDKVLKSPNPDMLDGTRVREKAS